MLHLFVFDTRWFRKLPLTGLIKTGPLRAQFWRESVEDLRQRLRGRGDELLVRHGASEDAFREIAERYSIDTVYAYDEVCSQEIQVDTRVRHTLTKLGTKLELLWGFTLYHVDDLPFDPKTRFPPSYTAFRKCVEENCRVRCVAERSQPSGRARKKDALKKDRLLPASGIPSLEALGLPPAPPDDPRSAGPWRGGETAALKWMEDYIWTRDCLGRDYVGATMTTKAGKCAIGLDNTTKLSPWLAHGCLSPRLLHEEIEKYERRRTKNQSTYWLKHEVRVHFRWDMDLCIPSFHTSKNVTRYFFFLIADMARFYSVWWFRLG